jgi:hypothetical protein
MLQTFRFELYLVIRPFSVVTMGLLLLQRHCHTFHIDSPFPLERLSQVRIDLQPEPHFRAVAKPLAEPNSPLRGNAGLAVHQIAERLTVVYMISMFDIINNYSVKLLSTLLGAALPGWL